MTDETPDATKPASSRPADRLVASGRPRPTPLANGALTASARRLTSRTLASRVGGVGKSWQDDAWEMFDLVGEHRFLAVTLAGRMSQARLYVGKRSDDPTEPPVQVTDPLIAGILDAVGSSESAKQQLIQRLGVNLFVAGDGWLAGIPRHLIPETLMVGGSLNVNPDPLVVEPPADGTLNIEDLEWRMLSISEVQAHAGGSEVQLLLGETEAERLKVSPDEIFLIRVWRPHPRRWWEADSPTRSSLPVLRELVGLTMHISAEVDSRLAGAGLLIIPQSAQRALQVAAGITEDEVKDLFTENLIEAMVTPIADRANASAIVPLCVTVPDEVTDKFNFIDFSKPIDQFSGERRNEAIRRLALGLDAPPELLLGTGGMNHWGAWLVLEDVVTTHLEPPLAVICDALTTQYLWPVLADQDMSPEEAQQYVVWYDVSDLVVRPNRGTDALALHELHVINDAALRAANGFDDADAPVTVPTEVTLALAACQASPTLFAEPGLGVLVEQIRAVLAGDTAGAPPIPAMAPAPTSVPGQKSPTSAPNAPPGGSQKVAGPSKVPSAVPKTDGAPAQPAAAASATWDLGMRPSAVDSQYVTVQVNGEARTLRNGDSLQLVGRTGPELTIIDDAVPHYAVTTESPRSVRS
jgi:hypothetical protein